jgi:hypothetical protein
VTSFDFNRNNDDTGGNYVLPTHSKPKHSTNTDTDTSSTIKVSRFSKFAPDTNTLNSQDFCLQLGENMKGDLERRRAADPNRGNQPTRNYLERLG